MVRWLSCILILCIASASVDAATDVESLGGCDEQVAHEAHSEPQGAPVEPQGNSEDPTSPADEQAAHFCHCAVHAPVLPSSAELIAVPTSESPPSIPTHLCGTYRTPPPVRPPKLG